ncbi:MAG TPA: hypothetical protein VH083_05515 [Myxococcales bacterium]|jgi:hypothetical protein|nr:hypothetical protein [Myxococcales bacterium]
MNGLISFLTLMVFLLVGITQHGDISKSVGYGIAIPLAVVTFGLAIVRYKGRSK